MGITLSGSGTTTLSGNSAITYDFTKNIGGLVSFVVKRVNGTGNFIGVSFTESSFWISPHGSDATQNVGIDETLWYAVDEPGNYSVDPSHQRGGFRYLNLYHNSSGSVELTYVMTNFTAMPHYAENALRDYTGYFHTDDEQLNRVWYASAYTDQLCTIPSDKGNSLVNILATDPDIPTWWYANSTLTNGSAALVDGAKRDKLIWPGDYSISLPGVFLSTNDQETLKLSMQQLFADQNSSTGQLPYAARPIYISPPDPAVIDISNVYSYTYHMYNLLGMNNYYTYSGDIDFLKLNWNRWVKGLNLSLSSVDSSGLAYVPKNATADWLRIGMGAHNIEANSILAYTLKTAISLAYSVGDTHLISTWQNYYDNIVRAANSMLWDESAGLFKDNQTTTLHPQDGNCWAVISGVANSTRAIIISNSLKARWGRYGAPAPEAYGNTVSPFISGFELQAHFIAGNPLYAIELMKFMWADFMLDDPRMTNSTFIEGYDTEGQLHYPAYSDDARISFAHGWATGPLLALTNWVAGLHVVNSSTWRIEPQPGNLSQVDAGFTTAIGTFASTYSNVNGHVSYSFQTPPGTSGTVVLSGITGSIKDANGTSLRLVNGVTENVAGGNWTLVLSGNSTGSGLGNGSYTGGASPKSSSTIMPQSQTTNDASRLSTSWLALAVVVAALTL